MAGKITTNSVVLGDSVTDTQNFVLKTNADGTATLARGALGGLGTVFGVNGSGALTGATLVAPALGTPASGVLTNCTGVVASALPAGSVLQVVHFGYSANASNSTTTFADTGVTATITPSSASSKILILISMIGLEKGNGVGANSHAFQILRGATIVRLYANYVGYTASATSNLYTSAFNYLDSPASTSALTYKVQFKNMVAAAVVICQSNSSLGDQSTITLMEIQG